MEDIISIPLTRVSWSQETTPRGRELYKEYYEHLAQKKYQYFWNMKIGSKQDPIVFLFDTNSPHTWVPGNKCPSD